MLLQVHNYLDWWSSVFSFWFRLTSSVTYSHPEEFFLVFLARWVCWQQISQFLFENVCISFSALKDGFAEYKILGCEFIFLSVFGIFHLTAFLLPLFQVRSQLLMLLVFPCKWGVMFLLLFSRLLTVFIF